MYMYMYMYVYMYMYMYTCVTYVCIHMCVYIITSGNLI